MRLSIGMLAALLLTVAPEQAIACSCGTLEPTFQPLRGARLPRDGRGLAFWCGGLPWVIDSGDAGVAENPVPSADEFAIERIDKRGRVPHTIEPIVEPAPWGGSGRVANALLVLAREPLVPGARYRFRGPGEQEAEVVIEDAAIDDGPLKLRVGEQTRATLTVGVGVSCSADVDAAQRAVSLNLGSLKRFAPSLLFATSVDGASWRPSHNICSETPPGRSWQGDGKELLFAVCGEQNKREGISPNTTHWVQMRVTIPGSARVLESARESFVLTCPTPIPPSPEPAVEHPESGCGACRAGPAPSLSHGLWLLMLLAGAALRRER